MSEKSTKPKYQNFINYVNSFYSPEHHDVLYPIIGLTDEIVIEAIEKRISYCAANNIDFIGDSFDREGVRDLAIEIIAKGV